MTSPPFKKRWPTLPLDQSCGRKSSLAQCVSTLMQADLLSSPASSSASSPAAGSPTSPARLEPTDDRTALESRFPLLRLFR
jgi:hypothetical protein